MAKLLTRGVLTGQRGFTLLELLAVMAIVAVLAGIVSQSVSGVSDASRDAQVLQDSGTMWSAAAGYFSDQEGAEALSPAVVAVMDVWPDVTQVISNRWPEAYVTSVYRDVLPPDATTTVTEIDFLDGDGAILSLVNPETNAAFDFAVEDILQGFAAMDFDILVDKGYIGAKPDSVDQTSGLYANYLWLLEKADAAGFSREITFRNIAIFKLIVVEKVSANGEQVVLVYQRIV